MLSSLKDSFWDTLWDSYKAVNGPFITVVVPVAVSVVLFLITGVGFWWKVALSVGALLCVALFILLLALFDAARKNYKGYAEAQEKYEEANERLQNPLPRILQSRASGPREPFEVVCLLEPSELFSQDNLVSFYDVGDEGLEVLIGVGAVQNVQTLDKKIQVALTWPADGYQEQVNELKGNNAAALKRTRVKPTVPRQYLLRSIFNGGR